MAQGNVDSMMFTGKTPWHSFGNAAKDAPNAHEGLKLSGQDWKVEAVPMFYGKGNKLTLAKAEGVFATTRTDTGAYLGSVSGKYKIFQNEDAFKMVDALLDMGAKIETAGALDGGKRTWILARLEPWMLLGDAISSYLFLANFHDGKGSLTAGGTNIRIVCENTFDAAIAGADRKWKIRHMGADLNSRIMEATKILGLNNSYREALRLQAETLAVKKVDSLAFDSFLKTLLPIDEEASDCVKGRRALLEGQIRDAAAVDNLANFKGTAWGVVQAVSDVAFHTTPARTTPTYEANLMKLSMDGHPMIQKAYDILGAM